MNAFFYSATLWLVLVTAIIWIHECGHYWAARLAGISKANVRIQMFVFPQHVVLRNSDGAWVKPWQQPLYAQLCGRYFGDNRRQIIIYVGAGLVVQSIFVWLGTWTLFSVGLRLWAFDLFILSVQITAIYFLAEIILYFFRRKPFGDFSGLWLLSKRACCAVCFFVVSLHLIAYSVFYR